MSNAIHLFVAHIVKFSTPVYDMWQASFDIEEEHMRAVILMDGIAIDIFTHQFYEIVPTEEGMIPLSFVSSIEPHIFYAYEIYKSSFSEDMLPKLIVNARETYRWYCEEYLSCKTDLQEDVKGPKVISLSEWKTKHAKDKKLD